MFLSHEDILSSEVSCLRGEVQPTLSKHSADDLTAVALNSRPRKTLDWRTPAETLDELLSNPSTAGGVATTP